jgi:hypothetical protein
MLSRDTQANSATNPTPDRFWFKVFNEVLQDMVFIDMSNQQLGIYVRLLALANSTRNVGLISGDLSKVARALRLDPDKVNLLHDLDARGLIYVESGVIAIADERHFEGKGLNPSDSREAQNERKRRQRAKVKAITGAPASQRHRDMSPAIEEVEKSTEQSNTSKSNSTVAQQKEGLKGYDYPLTEEAEFDFPGELL